ncbi:neogenin-like isoform X3 [Daphnia pulicaria]|uniref:neogenin-like isoform X3 n=1 Tax=Daphnia pulicaria TaxID=35523 RepID=UPI001EEA961E|nr:neogenin-like isoform X3 [Daphnia pulicaria]
MMGWRLPSLRWLNRPSYSSLRPRVYWIAILVVLVCCQDIGYCSSQAAAGDEDLVFTAEPQDAVVSKNSSVVIDCGVPAGWLRDMEEAGPAPFIEWKRDGVLLSLNGENRRSVLANGSLSFTSVQHSRNERPDEGLYQCSATRPSVGTIISRAAKLQIASLPRFELEPKDVAVRVGDTARFNCLVMATPAAHVRWLKDDLPLNLDPARMIVLPSGALELEQVQLSDQGYYRCNVSNVDKHRISAEAKLNVHSELEEGGKPEAPNFLAVPRTTVAIEGTRVTLECAANGHPRPDITWLKDGTTIDLDHLGSRFKSVGSGSLQIDAVTEEDVGVYQCRAENTEDSVDVTAQLEVQVPPRYITRPRSTTSHEKDDAELECQLYGRPEPTVQWTKNGELIIESEYFQIINGNNLKILGLVASDFGIYQCIGSNPAGNVQAAASLTIYSSDYDNGTSANPGMDLTTATSPTADSGTREAAAAVPPPPDQTSESSQPDGSITPDGNNDGSTSSLPSAPRDVEALIVSSRFVTLRWKEPVRTNGQIIGYSIFYRQEGSERERVVNTSRSRLEEVNVPGLQPGKKYSLRVAAFNEAGAGASTNSLEVETLVEPHVLQAPANLSVQAVSSVSLMASWESPDLAAAGGGASHGGQHLPIRNYKLFYMEVGSAEEHEVVTSHTSHLIHGLKPYTEYSVWVVAFNDNGPGTSTEEATARTWSDLPSDTPQNVVVEPASSSSVIVRWEPPSLENQNGIITGYKIRYKPKTGRGRLPLNPGSSNAGSTATTDGSRRLYTLTGLVRGTEYQVRVSALTVNGSGPMTEWMTAETFENDLDESQVPEPPSSLRARPMTNSISVSWNPPSNQNVMVRGYTIGWGKGIPDVYSKLVDGKQRAFVIEKLEANSEYVISLRAYNQMGDGRPIYETVRTREESTPEPPSPLIPPVGLKAIVLSSTTVVLYWTDTTLPRSQTVADSRYYVVRYTSSHTSSNPRYRYMNSTVLNCMLDDLKPNTQFEFAVKVIKNRRESPWSLVVPNTTFEAAPSSPPRDLTVVPVEENPSAINLNWQPPKQPNGQITGYVIFYTTDSSQRDRDWVVEGVVGDKMTTTIKGLTPDTAYFIKIQARNNKGYGPFSSIIQFRTNPNSRGISSMTLYIILGIATGIIVILLIVVLVVVFRRRDSGVTNSPDRSKKGYVKGNVKGGPGKLGKADNPPDLWIHHDQMEMKGLDKSLHRSGSVNTVSPLNMRRSQDLDSLDGMASGSTAGRGPSTAANDSLDRRAAYVTAYAGSSNSLRRPIKPKSLLISVATTTQPVREPVATVTPIPNGSLNQHSDSRPVYPAAPRPGIYPSAGPSAGGRAHVTVDVSAPPLEPTYGSQGSYDSRSSLVHPPPGNMAMMVGQPPSMAPPSSALMAVADAKRNTQLGHPLKSFTVPAPPPQSAPPVKIVSPNSGNNRQSVNPMTAQSSPYKKSLASGPVTSPPPLHKTNSSGGVRSGANDLIKSPEKIIQSSYSTEELNQEMANLEGLMKDLNAITANEFGC